MKTVSHYRSGSFYFLEIWLWYMYQHTIRQWSQRLSSCRDGCDAALILLFTWNQTYFSWSSASPTGSCSWAESQMEMSKRVMQSKPCNGFITLVSFWLQSSPHSQMLTSCEFSHIFAALKVKHMLKKINWHCFPRILMLINTHLDSHSFIFTPLIWFTWITKSWLLSAWSDPEET